MNQSPHPQGAYESVTHQGEHESVTTSRGAMKVAAFCSATESATPLQGVHESVTHARGAMKVAAFHRTNESVMTMHRLKNQILPSLKHI